MFKVFNLGIAKKAGPVNPRIIGQAPGIGLLNPTGPAVKGLGPFS